MVQETSQYLVLCNNSLFSEKIRFVSTFQKTSHHRDNSDTSQWHTHKSLVSHSESGQLEKHSHFVHPSYEQLYVLLRQNVSVHLHNAHVPTCVHIYIHFYIYIATHLLLFFPSLSHSLLYKVQQHKCSFWAPCILLFSPHLLLFSDWSGNTIL